MHVKTLAKLLLRPNSVLFDICHHGESFICTSSLQKNVESPTKLLNEKETKPSKKKTLLKWNSTNLAFFGPIIKESKRKKKQVENDSSNSRNDKQLSQAPTGMLIPVGLWNNLSDEKLSKRCKYQPGLNKSLEQEKSSNSKPPQPKRTCVKRIVKTVPDVDDTPIYDHDTKIVGEIPSQPFFVHENIILPFPMILRKKNISSVIGEIYSIPSAQADVPSVTQVLSKTMSEKSEMMLTLWRKRKIAELGDEGFNEFMREARLTGKDLHTSIETHLRGVDYDSVRVDPRISGHWLSLKSIFGVVNDVHVLESYVIHPQLQYKGFVDCVARYEDKLVAIEWKTSQRTKATLEAAYDDPVQIAAYIGALNADEKYPFEVENALLVVAYPTGRPADVIVLDRNTCQKYWNQWLKRLEAFNLLKRHSENVKSSE